MFGLLRNAIRFVVVYGIGGIVGWLAIEAVKAGITDPVVRDWVIAVLVPLSLVLMTVAFCVWIWKGDSGTTSTTLARPRVTRSAPGITLPKSGPRLLVPDTVTPAYLLGLFTSHTSREARLLLGDFLGKWMPVSGTVSDVSEIGDVLFVQMRTPAPDAVPVALSFRGPWKERVSTLRRGDSLTAIGCINDVNGLHVELDPAELPA